MVEVLIGMPRSESEKTCPTSGQGWTNTEKNETISMQILENGVSEGIRTPDPRFRKPVLYPAELPRREPIC